MRRSKSVLSLAVMGMIVVGALSVPLPASAAGTASIAGTVSDSQTSDPLEGITVQLYLPTAPLTLVESDITDASGAYSLPDLAAGTYKLFFFTGAVPPASNYQSTWYPSGSSFASAATFDLADGEALVADVPLDESATISGSVVGENGPTGAILQILIYQYSGGVYTGFAAGGSPIWNTATLTYEYRVPPGDYRVRFIDTRAADVDTYRDVVYDDVFSLDDGDLLTVGPGDTVALPTVTMTVLGPVTDDRLFGANRYETAVAVSSQFSPFGGSPNTYAYVASGANYPDALSAGPAAASRNAPLLLTEPNRLPTAVRDELIRLQPETVVIAGGTGVVSASVFAAIDAIVDNVVRLGGADRYETSRLIVDDAFASAETAFIATGTNFPDALAATAAAAKLEGPVLLVNGSASSLPAATSSLLGSTGLAVDQIFIAGGTAVVSGGVATALAGIDSVSTVTRLGGADRYATSLLINERVFQLDDVGDDPNVFLAVGTGFADALAGSALAGSLNAPLFTVPKNCVPEDVLDLFALIEVEKVWLLGGTAVLSNAVRDLTPCP